MEIKKVYFSQKMSLYSPIQQAKQPLPFFQSHQESRDAFWMEKIFSVYGSLRSFFY